jgi:ribosome modulation factor
MTATRVILSPGLQTLADRVFRATNRYQAHVAGRVHARVVDLTPVDRGTARSNWVVRRGSPFSLVYRAYAPGRFLGRGETANRAAALRQAAGVLRGHNDGAAIYITNNLPYIGRLNDGYSKQSPRKFVQRGITQGVGEARLQGFKIE